MMGWLVVFASLTVTAPPPATGGVLIGSTPEQRILVWKSAAAMTEGLSLLRARADVQRIVPLIACAPLPGTAVVEAADAPGQALHAVRVTQGEWAGCRGVVQEENFR